MGKTVIAIRLLLSMFDHTDEQDSPIPLRVNASRWVRRRRRAKPADLVEECLRKVLATDYHVDSATAKALVTGNRIVPIFDGLDEIDAIEARKLVAELNKPRWSEHPVILTCRKDIYDGLANAANAVGEAEGDAILHWAAVWQLRTLTAPQIRTYLVERENGKEDPRKSTRGSWNLITLTLDQQPNGNLAKALGTPWTLRLALAYLEKNGSDGAYNLVEAAKAGVDSLTEYLFATLIPSAVSNQHRYTSGQVNRWLRHLAQSLEQPDHGKYDILEFGVPGQPNTNYYIIHKLRQWLHDPTLRESNKHRYRNDISLDEIWELNPRWCRLAHCLVASVTLTLIGIPSVFSK